MKSVKSISIIILLISISISTFAQFLPNGMTEAERAFLPSYVKSITAKGFTSPPVSPVRNAAEWEEMDAIIIAWESYTSVLTESICIVRLKCLLHSFFSFAIVASMCSSSLIHRLQEQSRLFRYSLLPERLFFQHFL